MLRLSSISLLDISIPSLLFWFILFFGYFGYPLLWFGLDPYRSADIVDQLIILEMFCYSTVSITFLIVGFLVARVVLGPLRVAEALSSSFAKTLQGSRHFMALNCLLFLICGFVLYLYISEVGVANLGLLVALDLVSSDSNVTALRSDASNGFANYHWYRVFTADILLFCTLFFASLYFYQKSKFRAICFCLATITCALSLTLSGEKAQIMELLIGLSLIFSIKYSGGKVPVRNIIKFSLIGLVVITPIYYFLMGASGIFEALQQVGSRIFTGQLHPSYVYLQYFPEYRDFLFGATFPNPGSILPYEAVTITQEIMAWDNPKEVAEGIIGSMPAMFWVEAYINFGVLSLPFISLILGIFLYSINRFFFSLRFCPLVLSFYIWTILFYKDLALSFFSDFFINIYLFSTLLVFCVFYVISHRGIVFLAPRKLI